jgi:ubiquinol-cytochrome c reductase iron-sulfur subunit
MKKPSLCKKTPISVIQDKSPDLMLRRKLVTAVSVGFGLVTIATLVPLVESMAPSARARAEGGPVEINLSGIALGELRTIEWRQKPVWILRRTPEMLTRLQHHRNDLRDPDSKIDQQPVYAKNDTRSVKPEFFVAIGICTHLGCIPGFRPEIGGDLGSGWDGGFFCPCHGSKFDLAGRVFKGVPAPINLVIPIHRYISDTLLIVGEDALT